MGFIKVNPIIPLILTGTGTNTNQTLLRSSTLHVRGYYIWYCYLKVYCIGYFFSTKWVKVGTTIVPMWNLHTLQMYATNEFPERLSVGTPWEKTRENGQWNKGRVVEKSNLPLHYQRKNVQNVRHEKQPKPVKSINYLYIEHRIPSSQPLIKYLLFLYLRFQKRIPLFL